MGVCCCECCVLSGRGLSDELITRREESYLLWFLVVCDIETSCMRSPWPTGGCCTKNKHTYFAGWAFAHFLLFIPCMCYQSIDYSKNALGVTTPWFAVHKFLMLCQVGLNTFFVVTSVPKQVGVSVCHMYRIKKCIYWIIYRLLQSRCCVTIMGMWSPIMLAEICCTLVNTNLAANHNLILSVATCEARQICQLHCNGLLLWHL
jgi:hypothetical protein